MDRISGTRKFAAMTLVLEDLVPCLPKITTLESTFDTPVRSVQWIVGRMAVNQRLEPIPEATGL